VNYRVLVFEHAMELALDDGSGAGEIDATLHGFSRESASVRSERQGSLLLTVRAVDFGSSGRYKIELQSLGSDRRLLEADRLMSSAGRLAAISKSRESQIAAANKFGVAATLWADLRRFDDRAHALHARCELERRAGERSAAILDCEQARDIWRRLGNDHFVARVSTRLGLLYGEVGRSADAIVAHESALKIFHKLGDRRFIASASVNLGLILHNQGNLDGALTRYRDALAVYEPLDQRNETANLSNNIGGIHYMRGEASEAMRHFHRAIDIQRRTGNRAGEASALGNLALVQRNVGDLGAALATQAQVLAIRRERSDREGEARVLSNIGLIYLTLGDAERASALLAEALHIRRTVGDRSGEISTLRNLALASNELGDHPRALVQASESLRLADAARLRPAAAATRSVRGGLLLSSGDHDSALVEYVAAAEVFRDIGDRRAEAAALIGQGRARLAAGDFARAETSAKSALDLVTSSGYLPLHAGAQVIIALAAFHSGRHDDASRAVRAALDAIESLRGRMGTPELKASYTATVRDAYELAVELAVARDPSGATGLELAERVRARAFIELLDEPSLSEGRGGGAHAVSLRSKFRELTAEVSARNNAAFEGRHSADSSRVRAELDAVEVQLRLADPAFAAIRAPRSFEASRLGRLLDDDTTLLEYMIGERQSFLWVATNKSIRVHRLPPRHALEPAVRRVVDGWSRRVQGGDLRAAAAELSRMLFPIGALVGARPRLAIVADGPLEYLPFSALPQAKGRRLIHAHETVMLPSISSLETLRETLIARAPAPRALALIADPVFSRKDPRAPRCPTGACAEALGPPLPRLVGSSSEAQAVLALVPGDGYRAFGTLATRAAVLGGALRGHQIVHFATHGLLESSRPRLSGLMLSRISSNGGVIEGLLSTNDVAALSIDADLVVLSACETALGREIRGEGVTGLTRGFMHAGARRVVGTIWRIPDRAGMETMQRFYSALMKERLPASAALRRAQLEMSKELRWADPFYWAAFTIHGDWRG
jgi:CHAT domain-containing protein/tetratricopeptide (TPR) repeat protein